MRQAARDIEIGPVGTERLLGEKAAGRGVRSRAAAAAQRLIAALAALALERVGVSELLEDRRVVTDVLELTSTGAPALPACAAKFLYPRSEMSRPPCGRRQPRVMADRCWPCPPPLRRDSAAGARARRDEGATPYRCCGVAVGRCARMR
jgi:hypothetical protein